MIQSPLRPSENRKRDDDAQASSHRLSFHTVLRGVFTSREPVSSPFYLTTLWLSLNKVVDWGEQESHPTIVTRQLQLTTCFFSLESINQFQELIKEIASIVWTRCCIWVELH